MKNLLRRLRNRELISGKVSLKGRVITKQGNPYSAVGVNQHGRTVIPYAVIPRSQRKLMMWTKRREAGA